MIVSNRGKNAILLNPKTGTRAVLALFENDECATVLHPALYYYQSRHEIIPEADSYQYHSFFRCPINRCLSHYYYITDNWYTTALSIPVVNKYAEEIKSLTFGEYLTILEDNSDQWKKDGQLYFEFTDMAGISIAAPQVNWLNGNVNLLDYRDFDNECKRLQYIMGRSQIVIPEKRNVSVKERSAEELLTPFNIARIKYLYKDDYEFFSKRGITFDL